MTLKELIDINIKQHYSNWQLIFQRQVNDEYTPFFHGIYEDNFILFDTTSIKNIDLEKYIVLIPYYKPLDIGRNWKHWKYLNTIIITTYEELIKRYSKSQLVHWLIWLDREVRKEVDLKNYYLGF